MTSLLGCLSLVRAGLPRKPRWAQDQALLPVCGSHEWHFNSPIFCQALRCASSLSAFKVVTP